MGGAEPERELIRRIVPFAIPAAILAFAIGFLLSGSGAAWSAAIAIGVVTANFVANAWSLAWAASVSPVMVSMVALGGFVLRLGIIVAVIVLLQQLAWFSMVAFLAALVPATVALLIVEMKLLSGRMQGDLWTFPGSARGSAMMGLVGPVLAAFEPPTTHDFVWDCWGPGLKIGSLEFCMNFVFFIVLLGFVAMIAFFYFGLRRAKVVPGKLQSLAEMGVRFVYENIGMPMLGPDTARFMPLLVTLFFAIFFWNVWEIAPGINFSSNSRIAFPLVMALIAWFTYNTVGVMKHGFFGYLKHVCVPPGAPAILYILLVPIEFITQIIIRPITLSVRLWANFVAGHFLLAVFFLGTVAMVEAGLPTIVFAPFSFAIAVVLVGFELFVSALQAFIFAILTASYIGGAMAEEH